MNSRFEILKERARAEEIFNLFFIRLSNLVEALREVASLLCIKLLWYFLTLFFKMSMKALAHSVYILSSQSSKDP